jgi:hypothetical protein
VAGTLLGVMLGGALQARSASAARRAQFAHERHLRSLEERRAAYAKILNQCQRLNTLVTTVVALQRFLFFESARPKSKPADPEMQIRFAGWHEERLLPGVTPADDTERLKRAVQEFQELEREFYRFLGEYNLIAANHMLEAARRLFDAAVQHRDACMDADLMLDDIANSEEFSAAYQQFVQAARADVGLS